MYFVPCKKSCAACGNAACASVCLTKCTKDGVRGFPDIPAGHVRRRKSRTFFLSGRVRVILSGILWGCPRTSRTSRTPDRVVRTRGPDRPGHTPDNPFRSCDPDTTGHCSRTRVTGHPGHPGHSTKKIQTPAIASSGAINGPSARMSRLYLIIATRGIGLGFVFGAARRAPEVRGPAQREAVPGRGAPASRAERAAGKAGQRAL